MSLINDHWNPRIAGELNGQQVKLVKFKGAFFKYGEKLADLIMLALGGRNYKNRSEKRINARRIGFNFAIHTMFLSLAMQIRLPQIFTNPK